MKKLIALFIVLALSLTLAVPLVLAIDDFPQPGTTDVDGDAAFDPSFYLPDPELPYLIDLSDQDIMDWWFDWSAEGDNNPWDPGNNTGWLPYAGTHLWFGEANIPLIRDNGVLVNQAVVNRISRSTAAANAYWTDPLTYDNQAMRYNEGTFLSIFVWNPTSDRYELVDGQIQVGVEADGTPIMQDVYYMAVDANDDWIPLKDLWYDVSVEIDDFMLDGAIPPVAAYSDWTLTLFEDPQYSDSGIGFITMPFVSPLTPGTDFAQTYTNPLFTAPNALGVPTTAPNLDLEAGDKEVLWSFNAASGDDTGNLWLSNSRGYLNIPQGAIDAYGRATAVLTVDLSPQAGSNQYWDDLQAWWP